MTSARPVSGASSTEPCTLTISTCTPRRAKCARAVRGYFVAMRGMRVVVSSVSPTTPGDDDAASSDAEVHRLVRVDSRSTSTSRPQTPRSAVPYST